MQGPGKHGSHWMSGVEIPAWPALTAERDVDVAIVGGGITGLTAALLLATQGRSVIVLEARRIGQGTTGRTSAHLTGVQDCGFHTLESRFDAATARTAWETSCTAIDRIEALCEEHGIQCDFVRIRGYQLDMEGDDHQWFERHRKAAERCGIPFDLVESPELPVRAKRAMRFDHQARFHPMKYLTGLAAALANAGGELFECSRVLEVDAGEPCTLSTEHGRVRAKHVILATHTPIGAVLTAQARMTAMRSYCLTMRLTGGFPDALLWNSREPYDYIRKDGDVLIVGGRDHRTGTGVRHAARWRELETWARQNLPVSDVTHRWSANLYEPADGLPYIGAVPGMPGVYMATGYSGTGLTFGTAAAMLLSERILDREHPWSRIYTPARLKPLASAGRMVEENVGTAWHFFKDRLAPSEVQSIDAVPTGEGRLLRINGKKMACYRDPEGEVHVMSAVCSHLSCIVRWNDAEASWDCPCHGSRFGPTGEVLDGPAIRDLEPAPSERAQGPQTTPPAEPEQV